MLASSKFATDLGSLLHGYQLCAATESKSANTIAIVVNSARYLYDFLNSNDMSTDVYTIEPLTFTNVCRLDAGVTIYIMFRELMDKYFLNFVSGHPKPAREGQVKIRHLG